MNFKTWLKDTEEKAVNNLWQALLPFLALGVQWDVSWWKPVVAALITVLFGVIKNAATTWMPQPKGWAEDAVVRVAWTFLIAFCGAASAGGIDLYSVPAWHALLMAALPAVLATVKVIVAKRVSNTISPASLAAAPAPTPVAPKPGGNG